MQPSVNVILFGSHQELYSFSFDNLTGNKYA